MERKLSVDELASALRACIDKNCKKCPIGLGFGCAQNLIRAAAEYVEREEGEKRK